MIKRRIVLLFIFIPLIFSCVKKNTKENFLYIAVFIPGVRAESPVYEMLAAGVEHAAAEAKKSGKNVDVTIIEAGTNQAEWALKLTALAAEKKYDAIISSNPSMPSIAAPILNQFPHQKFLFFDAYDGNSKQIATFQYNQLQQGWLSGTMAGLVTTSSMPYANKQKKIGLIAGQKYPAMLNVILPAFIAGAQFINTDIEVDFRIIGNWYDAAKAAELARAMFRDGCDVIMVIAGGANQGVLSAAQDEKFYVAWFDDNGYNKAPGFVIASSTMAQKRLVYEQTLQFINGKTEFGKHNIYGMEGKYIQFIEDDPLYIKTIPQQLREAQHKIIEQVMNGSLIPKAAAEKHE